MNIELLREINGRIEVGENISDIASSIGLSKASMMLVLRVQRVLEEEEANKKRDKVKIILLRYRRRIKAYRFSKSAKRVHELEEEIKSLQEDFEYLNENLIARSNENILLEEKIYALKNISFYKFFKRRIKKNV